MLSACTFLHYYFLMGFRVLICQPMTPEQRASLLLSTRNLRYYYQICFSSTSERFNKGQADQRELIGQLGRLKETDRQIKELEGYGKQSGR